MLKMTKKRWYLQVSVGLAAVGIVVLCRLFLGRASFCSFSQRSLTSKARLLYTESHPAAWMYFSVCGLVGLGTAFLFILVTQCAGALGVAMVRHGGNDLGRLPKKSQTSGFIFGELKRRASWTYISFLFWHIVGFQRFGVEQIRLQVLHGLQLSTCEDDSPGIFDWTWYQRHCRHVGWKLGLCCYWCYCMLLSLVAVCWAGASFFCNKKCYIYVLSTAKPFFSPKSG